MTAEDPQTFVAGLAESHARKLRRFLTRRVRNVADIPDIIQEVYLRMLRISDHEVIRSPEAYLFTVAHHVAQQHALREATAPPSIEITQMSMQLPANADTDPTMLASADECLERLDRTLSRLSPKARATFLLHRRHGLTLEQIGKELGISFPMAKKYLAQTLFHLRRHMENNAE